MSVKLGDVCEIISGSTPKTGVEEYWDGDLCWITPAEITDDDIVITDTNRKISEAGAKSCSLTLMPVGTVLLSSRAPIGKSLLLARKCIVIKDLKILSARMLSIISICFGS